MNVVVGLAPDSKRRAVAEKDGLTVYDTAKAAEIADMIMILVPDHAQPEVYEESIKNNLKEGDILMFAHGFNIHYNQIDPPENVDVIMVAPKGPGHTVRSQYLENKGVPSLIAVHRDYSGKARDFALAYACGIGAGRAGDHRNFL